MGLAGVLQEEKKNVSMGKLLGKASALALLAAIVIAAACLILPVSYAADAETSAYVRNTAPTVAVELIPDDDPFTPGVQVINPLPATNKTVTIHATVTDLNGYDQLTGVVSAVITGPSPVNESPVTLSLDYALDETSAVYTGSFNLSVHLEGEYTVEVTTADNGGLPGEASATFTYLYAAPPDTTPPEVMDPDANPDALSADGLQESRLNVTVTDASGIYSVIVDLTAVGGPAAQPLINIPGTEIYTTTTTAAVGTTPGTYLLPVNATDDSPNRNSNTSISVPLTVLPPAVVTTYDFSNGAGTTNWAYFREHDARPPATNDVPIHEFPPGQYRRISTLDGRSRSDVTATTGSYALHRFVFTITEPESSITALDVLWIGQGRHDWGLPGATLYLWNFETGAYERLAMSTRTYITLTGTITDDVADYINEDGILILLAEQNTPQRQFWVWKFRSRLATDYVKVDVTHTPNLEASMNEGGV